ncbi:hypothetical protein GGR56DRAFT_644990, partial [Xylariaceae sp. FL0804]
MAGEDGEEYEEEKQQQEEEELGEEDKDVEMGGVDVRPPDGDSDVEMVAEEAEEIIVRRGARRNLGTEKVGQREEEGEEEEDEDEVAEENDDDDDDENSALIPSTTTTTTTTVERCSAGTWIAPEDCLTVLREMGVVVVVDEEKEEEDKDEEEDDDEPTTAADAGGTDVRRKAVLRLRVDRAEVRRWVAEHRLDLARKCDPQGFVGVGGV